MKNILFKIAKKLNLIEEIEKYRKLGVKIGKDCKFYNVRIDNGHAYLVEIGDKCILTNCTLLAHDASTKLLINKTKVGKIKIGNNCFIGLGSIILPNVTIGDNCIIGAGSVIAKDIPENSVVVGNPARIISTVTSFKEKHKEFLKEKPVFNTYWKNKTEEEKEIEKQMLEGTFGYDE